MTLLDAPAPGTKGLLAAAPVKTFHRPFFHVLSGARFPTLLRILANHGGCSPRYIGQVALTLAISLLREPFYTIEAIRVARRVRAVTFDTPPVIILGHWRSGTTYLHNLMSRDPRFCFPTIHDAALPYEFYPGPLGFLSRTLLRRSLPPKRQVDDMPLRIDLPQEDEIALASMGAPSFFNCFYFPARYAAIFRREVLFQGISPREMRTWRRHLVYYLAKIAALHPSKRLLLKNPAHSAHAAALKLLFPNAKFIHIHRDPIDVFVSMRKLLKVTFSIVALQDHDEKANDEHILTFYPEVMDRLCDDLDAMAPGACAEVRYADLVRQPVETLERLYRELDLGDFELARSAITGFAAEHEASPRPPRPLDFKLTTMIRQRWQRQMVRLGYEEPALPAASNG